MNLMLLVFRGGFKETPLFWDQGRFNLMGLNKCWLMFYLGEAQIFWCKKKVISIQINGVSLATHTSSETPSQKRDDHSASFTSPPRRGLFWLIKIEHIHWTQCWDPPRSPIPHPILYLLEDTLNTYVAGSFWYDAPWSLPHLFMPLYNPFSLSVGWT